jgi:hypothetical protein
MKWIDRAGERWWTWVIFPPVTAAVLTWLLWLTYA